MNKIFNWIFGSFFRTFGRVLVYILLGFVLFNLINLKDIKLPKFTDLLFINVSAETFTDNSRFSWYVYNGNNLLNSGQGLFTYQTNQASRTEFLYQYYTFYNQYYYDITFDITIDSGNWSSNANGCNIGIPGASTFTSYFTKDYSGDYGHLKCSVYNFTANQLSNLFINFYNNLNQTILYNVVDYELSIDAKENTNPTSESINQGFNSVINSQNNNANNIINNQNSNTQSIIDNQNQNKTDIINNQNANTDKEIESQKVCTIYQTSINEFSEENKAINSVNGNISNNSYWNISKYYEINKDTIIEVKEPYSSAQSSYFYCFYTINKEVVSCSSVGSNTLTKGSILTIPDNAYYFRSSILKPSSVPLFEIETCKNGNQAMSDSLNDMNTSINDSDSSGATSDASSFFSNFTTDTHGLTGIITAPLNAINSLTNQSCSPLVLPLPFVEQDLTLPCMRDIYVEHFGSFMTLYDVITLGIVSYWVMVRIFGLVKDFKNPEHDEIEVVDL